MEAFMRKFVFILLALSGVLFVSTLPAGANVVVFDNISSESPGLSWSNWSTLSSVYYNAPGVYGNHVTFPSGPNMVLGGGSIPSTISSANPFNVEGAYFATMAYHDNYGSGMINSAYRVTVTGTRGESVVGSVDIDLNIEFAKTALNFNNIDKLTLTGAGNKIFIMDNFTYNTNPTPTPLPGSLLLLAPGLVGLAAVRKRIAR
jgi:hypothetical protein